MNDLEFNHDGFLVTFPVWILTTPDSLIVEEDGRTCHFSENPVFFSITLDGVRCMLVFTDEDLAQRHIEENKLVSCVPCALRDNIQLMGFLRLAEDKVPLVAFDVPGPKKQFRHLNTKDFIKQMEGYS
jgi:hypothetical protein